MKKVLSVVLALIMTLSLVVVGTPAAWADPPAQEGKVFAGYYANNAYATPLESIEGLEASEYVEKFVSKDVLQTKYQLKYLANEDDATTRIRVVTTVDSTHYQEVGFYVSINDGAERQFASHTVAKAITGTDGLGTLTYVPTDFSDESRYFCAFNFNVAQARFGTKLSFTAYWVTPDGQEVRGEKRDIKINESESFNNYLISNASEMYAFATTSQSRDFAGWKVKLTADIDLNPGCTASASGMSGTPTEWNKTIGTVSRPFAGTFDGQGHTVSGLYLDHEQQNAGMFAATASTATVKDFRLTNSYLNNDHNILGSIVGLGAGTLQSVYSNAFVKNGYHYVGGLVGQVKNSSMTISNCWFDGSVEWAGSKTKDGYAGIVGYDNGSTVTISDCLFTGTVSNSTQNRTGGIVGALANSASLQVTDSLSAGTVAGGSNCGMIVGCNEGGSTVRITTSYIVDDEGTANVIGYKDGTSGNIIDYYYNNSYYENQARNTGYKNIPIFIKGSEACHGDTAVTTLAGFDFANNWITVQDALPDLRCFNKFGADIIKISTAAELMELATRSQTDSFAGKTVKLTADIDMNEGWTASATAPANEWTSIGKKGNAFAGTFDGQGHTISGVYMNATAQRQGLFGETASTAVVKDFRLTNSYFTTSQAIFGAVVGYGAGTLRGVYSDATVESPSNYVGMVGYVGAGMNIEECWFAGAVTCTGASKDNYGGIVGFAGGTVNISDCLFTGTVTNSGRNRTGGFVGTVESATLTITDSLCAGTVVGGDYSGLMVGCGTDGKPSTVHFVTAYALGDENTARIVGYKYSADAVNVDYVFNGVPGYSERNNSNYYNIPVVVVDESKASEQYRGDAAATILAGFDFADTWTTVDRLYPVPSRFASIAAAIYVSPWVMAGTAENPYVLNDAAELAEFATLSQTDDFAGKTVKLGADIDMNEGWTASAAAPENAWTPISTYALPFAGTFDGDGHTVKGLYFSGSGQYKGMFAAVAAAGAVQNVTLANSYFASTGKTVGAVAGRCAGSLSAVHCAADVSVSGAGNVGGLLGEAYGAGMLLDGCSFAGSVVNASASQPNVGGLIGIYNVTADDMMLTMQNCLFTGTVDAAANYTDYDPSIGGFLGRIYRSKSAYVPTVLIDSCLSAGTVTPNEAAITEATARANSAPYGRFSPLVGNSPATGIVEIARTYVTDEVCPAYNDLSKAYRVTCTNVRADYNAVTEEAVKADAETAMPLLNWSAWQASAGNFPVPAASGAGAVSYAASSSDTSKLDALYAGRTLYRGDLHEHAGQSYNKWNDVYTNEVSYAEYAEQIDELGIDFAVSLNHHETAHIDDPNWDRSKFVYGTEAGTAIVSGNTGSGAGKIHFDILFKDKEDLQYIINKYMDFDAVTGEYLYNDAFTRAGFIQMINEVTAMGGFFNIPHPNANDYSDNAMDYWFVDGIGIHVISHSYWDAASNGAQRDLWISLLNAGKKVYATAGTDEHNALTGTSTNTTPYGLRALTSVYADSSAAADKGNLIPYLLAGDFTAGDAAIQMCVGSGTKMGGTCSFDGNDLVIRIAEKGSNKYRVNVLSNEGLVYSRELKVGSDTEIRLPADSSAMYYRVEVIDTTMTNPGVVVAYGNPIWND